MCNCNEQTIRIVIGGNGGCGCGGGCGCQPEQIDEDDIGLPDDPPDDPQPDPTRKCDASHFIAVTTRNILTGLAQGQWSNYPTFRDGWVSAWNVLPEVPTPPNFGSWNLMLVYLSMDVPSYWDIIHNNYVCSLSQADSQYDALERTREFAESLPSRLRWALRILATYVNYDILFNPLVVLPPGYEGRSCCGATPPPPPEPGEEPPPPPEPGVDYYYLVIPLEEAMVESISDTLANGSISDNTATMTPTGAMSSIHQSQFLVDVDVVATIAEGLIDPGETVEGVVGGICSTFSEENNVSDQFRVSSYTGGNTGWLIGNVNDGRFLLWHSSESVPPPGGMGTPEFEAWVESDFDGNNLLTSAGLLFDGNKASFTMLSFSSSTVPAAVLSADVWIVVRVNT